MTHSKFIGVGHPAWMRIQPFFFFVKPFGKYHTYFIFLRRGRQVRNMECSSTSISFVLLRILSRLPGRCQPEAFFVLPPVISEPQACLTTFDSQSTLPTVPPSSPSLLYSPALSGGALGCDDHSLVLLTTKGLPALSLSFSGVSLAFLFYNFDGKRFAHE